MSLSNYAKNYYIYKHYVSTMWFDYHYYKHFIF